MNTIVENRCEILTSNIQHVKEGIRLQKEITHWMEKRSYRKVGKFTSTTTVWWTEVPSASVLKTHFSFFRPNEKMETTQPIIANSQNAHYIGPHPMPIDMRYLKGDSPLCILQELEYERRKIDCIKCSWFVRIKRYLKGKKLCLRLR